MNEDKTYQADRLRIVTALIDCLNQRDPSQLVNLLGVDIVMKLPYASEKHPVEMRGRSAVIEAVGFVVERFDSFKMAIQAVYHTPAGDVVILELTSVARLANSSRVYQNRYVSIFQFQGDRIVAWTEYFNPERVRLARLH